MGRLNLIEDTIPGACGKCTMDDPAPSGGGQSTVSARHPGATSSSTPLNRVPGLLQAHSIAPRPHRLWTFSNQESLFPSNKTHSLLPPSSKTPPQTPVPTTNKTPFSSCNCLQDCGWYSGQGGMMGWLHLWCGAWEEAPGIPTFGRITVDATVARAPLRPIEGLGRGLWWLPGSSWG